MNTGDQTRLRKLDHIRITIDSDIEHHGTSLLEEVFLTHQAIPETSLDDIDSSIEFLGKRINAPIMVTGMTGGHEATAKINCDIASVVEELGLAMGVGSQRAAIENKSLSWTFKAARDCAPSAPLVANIGAPQLAEGYGVREVIEAIEMIDADAIAIHLNAAQEVFQPEGNRNFAGVIDKIAEIVDSIEKPVIVKETGHGISYEVAYRLASKGVRYFDVSGAGGTSWVLVERYRGREDALETISAEVYGSWGIPTALSIIETRWAAPSSCIIASGGIRTGLDALRSITLGANLAGLALPAIRAYARSGRSGVHRLLERIVYEFRVGMFLTGCRSIECLHRLRIGIGPRLRSLASQRGIHVDLYLWLREAFSARC
ncbi:MAG: type 2 isopentenyl-diphosphate Delta-isomerase [Pyrodictiaceae archaeon]